MGMEIQVEPAKVRNYLYAVVLLLVLAHVSGMIAKVYLGHGFPIVDLDGEATVPALFSTVLLLCSSALFLMIALVARNSKEEFSLRWFGLAAIFLFLAVDESCEIHERINYWLRLMFQTTGLLYSAWILPYGIFVVAFVLYYWRFLFRLPSRTRSLFIVAGGVYVTGALILEALGERFSELRMEDTLAFGVSVIVEEVLEMVGVIVLIYAVLDYIAAKYGQIRFHLRSQ